MTNYTKLLTVLLATIWLSACGSTNSDCPPPKEYSRAFQDRLADELAAMPADSATATALADYHVERRMLKACRA